MVQQDGTGKVWDNFSLVPCDELSPKITPYHFQQWCVFQTLQKVQFVNGAQTGLGKTLMSYMLFFYYRKKYPDTKLLIVTNKSAVIQFTNELHGLFVTDLKLVPVHSGGERGTKETYKEFRQSLYGAWAMKVGDHGSVDGLVMNYSVFRIDISNIIKSIDKLKSSGCRLVVIFDEATAFKKLSTKTWRGVSQVSSRSDRVLALTATIYKGKLEEVYSILAAIGVRLCKTKVDFERRFCLYKVHPRLKYVKTLIGYQNVQDFVDMVKPYLVVIRKIDVMDELPTFTSSKVWIEHSEDQIRLLNSVYQGLISNEEYAVKNNSVDDVTDIVSGVRGVAKLTQTSFIKMALLDSRLVHRQNLTNPDPALFSPKTVELLRCLNEDFGDEKIVVYSHSKQYINLLLDVWKTYLEIPDFYRNILHITGAVSGIDRQKSMDLFTHSTDHNLILLNTAGLESINLQAGSVMLVTTMPFSFGDLVQLAGRISRLGSKHKNLLIRYLLIKDSQDEDEYSLIMEQGRMSEAVIGEAEKGLLDRVQLMDNDLNPKDRLSYLESDMSLMLVGTRQVRAGKYGRLVKKLNKLKELDDVEEDNAF